MKWKLKRYAGLTFAVAFASCLISSVALTASAYPQDAQDFLNNAVIGEKRTESDGSTSIPFNGYVEAVSPAPVSPPTTSTTYRITYDACGGTGGHEDSGIQAGAAYTVLSDQQTGVSRTGNSFSGWNTMKNGSGRSYLPGSTLTVTGNVVLYAQWKKQTDGEEDGVDPGEPPDPTDPEDPADPDDPAENTDPTDPPEPNTHLPPNPSKPGNTLVPGDDGTYIELDEDGIPLGVWELDGNGEWIFREFPDIETLPKTGDDDMIAFWILGLCASLSAMAFLIRAGRRRKQI